MNYTLQNIVSIIIFCFVLIFASYFLYFRQTHQYIAQDISKIGCMHTVYVTKDTLQPTVKQGVLLVLNQCTKEKVSVGDIVYVKDAQKKSLGILKEISEESYDIDTDSGEYITVNKSEIIAYISISSEE